MTEILRQLSSSATIGGGSRVADDRVRTIAPGSAAAASGAALGADEVLRYSASEEQELVQFFTTAIPVLRSIIVEAARRQGIDAATALAGGGSAITVAGAGAGASPVPSLMGGVAPTRATSRTSVVPRLAYGQGESLRLATGQVTWRQVDVPGGATITPPASTGGAKVELYVVRDHVSGAHRTQVLEAVTGPVQVPAGSSAKVMARVVGTAAGRHAVDVAGSRLVVDVSSTRVPATPMMTWINEKSAAARGASGAQVARVLEHFGISGTGNSGDPTVTGAGLPAQFFSVAYEVTSGHSPQDIARRIMDAEAKARRANPDADFWVQVSDEQDHTAAAAQRTASVVGQVREILKASGSGAKLLVTAQARPHNLVYASVIDGWATTQSASGRVREVAFADIHRAAARAGHRIEIMEYPGNRYYGADVPGAPVVSTASAALDGASGWFIYTPNNQDKLEGGDASDPDASGDIGGLVVVDRGRVLPTLALIETELGASLGATARVTGATATSGARQVNAMADLLDTDRPVGGTLDVRTWEQEIGARLG